MNLEDKFDTLAEATERLIRQNLHLGSKVIALETICAYALAQTFLTQREPMERLLDLTAEMGGTATAVADRLRSASESRAADLGEISATIERISYLAEETLRLKTTTNPTTTA